MYRRHSMISGNDKRQHYIASFITKLSESDSKQKYFTKSELIEIHSFLRKEIYKNNWLYKLIQNIVDNGEFLDEDTLEVLKNLDPTFEDVNDNYIDEMQNKLDEKLKYLQIIDYNENLIRKRLEDSNEILVDKSGTDQDEIMNDLKNLMEEINKVHNKFVGTDEENKNIENSLIEMIRNLLLTICKCNYSFVDVSKKLQNDLIAEIDKLLFDYLNEKSVQQESSKAAKDLITVIESKCATKKQYLYLNKIVENAKNLLETFNQQLTHYKDHCQLKNELNDIRIKMDELLNQFIYSKIKSETDVYTELLSLIQNNESYLNYDKIIEHYESMNSKLILIQHKLDNNYN